MPEQRLVTGEESKELPKSLALKVLTQGVTDGITILDATGRLVYANEVAATLGRVRRTRRR